MLEQPTDGSVARLVVGDDFFFVARDDFGLLLKAAYNAVYGIQKVLLLDDLFVLACGHQGGFVAHVGDVGSAKTRCLAGQKLDVYVFAKLEWAQVDVEDFNALRNLR